MNPRPRVSKSPVRQNALDGSINTVFGKATPVGKSRAAEHTVSQADAFLNTFQVNPSIPKSLFGQ